MMEAAAAAPAPAHTWPTVAIYNDKSSGVADADAEKIVEAVAHQVLYDFGPRWNAGGHFVFVPSSAKPPAGAWCIAILASSDQAGALGYHDLTPEGLPLGKVFAATDRQFGSSLSVTVSHEALEVLADPWIALSAEASDGKFYAWEACDAVEADQLGYQAFGLQVSAFVCPGWFGSGDPNELCFPAGRVSRPLELAPGGYISVFDPASGRGWSQVQSQSAPGDPSTRAGAQDAYHALPRVGSRRERRFRGRGSWVLSTYGIA